MNEIIHGYVISVILTKFRINANIQLWQSFSILNFEIGIVSDFLQYINPCSLMPCPFTGPKMFWTGPNFLCQNKNLSTYCPDIVAVKNILCQKKDDLHSVKLFLCRHKSFFKGTKCSQIFGLAQKIWTDTKHFGTCKRTRH